MEAGGVVTYINGGRDGWNFHGATMRELAKFMSTPMPVRDRTGLTGRYDFSPPRMSAHPNGPPSTYGVGQLGLELKRGKENSPVLVIDHAERPSRN